MAQNRGKTASSQGLREKSEIGNLFLRLNHSYAPFPSSSFLPPFPLQLIAQARAWRGHPLPNRRDLVSAVQAIDAVRGLPVRDNYCYQGESTAGGVIDVQKESESWFTLDDGTVAIRAGWLAMTLVLTEMLFRVLRVLELELEPLVPELLCSRGLSAERSRAEFVRMWEERSTGASTSWVLAAGNIALGIGGRPPLFAPQIAAAAIAARLQQERVDEMEALAATANLASVLLNRRIRPEEIRHWRDLFYRVKVPRTNGESSLPQYISCELAEDKRLQNLVEISTPSTFLNALAPPTSTCVDIASLIPQIQREKAPRSSPRKNSSLKEKTPLQKLHLFTCRLCVFPEMRITEIWPHLKNHGIREEEMDIPEDNEKAIYRKGTDEILATLRQIKV